MIITVTGKVGNGKSTVSKMLKEYLPGSHPIRPDIIGIRLLSSAKVKRKILNAFGKSILQNNIINRKKLAQKAFANKESLIRLNSISHPLMIRKIMAITRKNKISIIDAALFNELKLDKISDVVVLVKARDIHVKKRVPDAIYSRRRFQAEPKKADFIIWNNDTVRALGTKVKKVAMQIKKLMENAGKK